MDLAARKEGKFEVNDSLKQKQPYKGFSVLKTLVALSEDRNQSLDNFFSINHLSVLLLLTLSFAGSRTNSRDWILRKAKQAWSHRSRRRRRPGKKSLMISSHEADDFVDICREERRKIIHNAIRILCMQPRINSWDKILDFKVNLLLFQPS